jgi:hypothetical protein
MNTFVATLGRNPAPVAQGFAAALEVLKELGRSTEINRIVLLLEDRDETVYSPERLALERWLLARAAPDAILVSERISMADGFGAAIRAVKKILPDPNPDHFFVCCVTGGEKSLSFAALEEMRRHDSSISFAINPHASPGMSITFLPGVSPCVGTRAFTSGLEISDYLELYLSHQLLEVSHPSPDAELQRFLSLRPGRLLRLGQNVFLVCVDNGVPLVARIEQLQGVHSFWKLQSKRVRDQMYELRDLVNQVCGDLGVPLFHSEPKTPSSDFSKNLEENLKDVRGREIALAFVQGAKRDPAPIREWVDPLPLSGLGINGIPGPVLISLVSDQLLPSLMSAALCKPCLIILLTSSEPKLVASTNRLRAVLEERLHLSVLIDATASNDQPESIAKQLEYWLNWCQDRRVVINMNGLTTAMSSVAYLWCVGRAQVSVEYVRTDRMLALDQKSLPRAIPSAPFGFEDVFRAYGFEPRGHDWPDDSEGLYQAALKVVENGKQNFHDFTQLWQSATGQKPRDIGIPGEYLTYIELKRLLEPLGADVRPALGLMIRDQTERWQPKYDFDVVVFYRWQVFLIECKPTLEDSLDKHREGRIQAFFGELTFGHFARGMIVSLREGDLTRTATRTELNRALQRRSRTPGLWLGIRVPDQHVDGLLNFPPDLPELFESWGWM